MRRVKGGATEGRQPWKVPEDVRLHVHLDDHRRRPPAVTTVGSRKGTWRRDRIRSGFRSRLPSCFRPTAAVRAGSQVQQCRRNLHRWRAGSAKKRKAARRGPGRSTFGSGVAMLLDRSSDRRRRCLPRSPVVQGEEVVLPLTSDDQRFCESVRPDAPAGQLHWPPSAIGSIGPYSRWTAEPAELNSSGHVRARPVHGGGRQRGQAHECNHGAWTRSRRSREVGFRGPGPGKGPGLALAILLLWTSCLTCGCSALRCYTDVKATKSRSVECGLNTGCVKIFVDSEEMLYKKQQEYGYGYGFQPGDGDQGNVVSLPDHYMGNPVLLRGCFVLAVPDRCYMAKNGLSYCWCSTKDLCNSSDGLLSRRWRHVPVLMPVLFFQLALQGWRQALPGPDLGL